MFRRLTPARPLSSARPTDWTHLPPRLPGLFWHRSHRHAPRFCRVEWDDGILVARFLGQDFSIGELSGEWVAA